MSQVDIFYLKGTGTDAALRITVADYSAEEIIQRFLSLYNCLDFKAELEDLGISRFQVFRRKKALLEFRALCIALWGLALQKSFPEHAEDFFEQFRGSAPDLSGGGKDALRMRESVNIYVELLEPKKDADFMPVAERMAGFFASGESDLRRQRLKLSLVVRNLYKLIFNKLV